MARTTGPTVARSRVSSWPSRCPAAIAASPVPAATPTAARCEQLVRRPAAAVAGPRASAPRDGLRDRCRRAVPAPGSARRSRRPRRTHPAASARRRPPRPDAVQPAGTMVSAEHTNVTGYDSATPARRGAMLPPRPCPSTQAGGVRPAPASGRVAAGVSGSPGFSRFAPHRGARGRTPRRRRGLQDRSDPATPASGCRWSWTRMAPRSIGSPQPQRTWDLTGHDGLGREAAAGEHPAAARTGPVGGQARRHRYPVTLDQQVATTRPQQVSSRPSSGALPT